MKKQLLILCLAAFAAVGNAQITQGTIGNGTFVDYSGISNQAYGIDFNNDGNLEFRIRDFASDVNYGNCMLDYVYSENGNNIVADAEIWDYMGTLQQGTVIGPGSNFAGYGDAYFNTYEQIPASFYVGFRIALGNNIHYGWALVNFSNNNATWVKCYYNATPNAPINAGQESGGGVGIDNANHIKARIAVLGNCQISISQYGDSQVSIFDGMGRMLMQQCNEGVIQLPAPGLYVVRVGNTNHKIMVY